MKQLNAQINNSDSYPKLDCADSPSPVLAYPPGRLKGAYNVLAVMDQCLAHCRTIYLDTGDSALYRRHRAGLRSRYGVRSREYVDSHGASPLP